MRSDQNRVSGLIVSTVIKLCEKGLDFSNSVKIQGVIGITVDEKDTFVIHVNKIVSDGNAGENSPLSTRRISSSNTIQEPSSSGHREGAVSVESTGSLLNTNSATQNNLLLSNIKVERPDAQLETSFRFHQSTSKDGMNMLPNSCKIEVDNSAYGTGAGFAINDEDTSEFPVLKTEESQDIKPNLFMGQSHNVSGVIDIPSDEDDSKYEPKQDVFSAGQYGQGVSQQPLRFPLTKQPRLSPHRKQKNLQLQPAMTSRNDYGSGQLKVPYGEGAIRAASHPISAANKMALAPIRHPNRFQTAISQSQSFQVRPRIPHQGHSIRIPRGKAPTQTRPVNTSRRVTAPIPPMRAPSKGPNGGGRGRGSPATAWRGENVAEQVVECQSGDGFSFNKQLTVLSRYCCNLCGKVYKNQRSVLHHQSQVHGRPKVKRRKKADASMEEGTFEEDNYEEDYNEEAW